MTVVAGIFLSYRREDAGGHAGRLYDKLANRFGAEMVFRDIDTLRPGANFVEHIESSVAAADVVLAMIGRDWVAATDADGRPRLEDANDYVRLELEAALRRDILVIPVLVRNATMPRAADLPGELVPLAQRNAFELPDQHWPFAVDALLAAIEEVAPTLGSAAHGNRGEVETAGSTSAWELALDRVDVSRLEPSELVEKLKAVCADFDGGRRPGEAVITFATASTGTSRQLLILTSEVLEIHSAEKSGKKGAPPKCARELIRLSNVQRVRIVGRLSKGLMLYLKTPVEVAPWPGDKKIAVESIQLVLIRPKGRINEIARGIQTLRWFAR
jgi:hypothetical protein